MRLASFQFTTLNTASVDTCEIEGVKQWAGLTYSKLVECPGPLLNKSISKDRLHQTPPIPEHFHKRTSEAYVEAILLKHNHVRVDCALQIAAAHLEDYELDLPVSWAWGSLSTLVDDTRLRPDWAGTVHSENPPYRNRVPGDTKQSAKWTSNLKDSEDEIDLEEFRKPLNLVLLYCIRANTRCE